MIGDRFKIGMRSERSQSQGVVQPCNTIFVYYKKIEKERGTLPNVMNLNHVSIAYAASS